MLCAVVSIAGFGLVGSSCWRGLASERGVLHGEDSWLSLIFPGSPGVSAVLGGSLSSGSAVCACSTFSVSAISSGVASVISSWEGFLESASSEKYSSSVESFVGGDVSLLAKEVGHAL